MKTITKEYQVYAYEELKGQGKEKAKQALEELIVELRFEDLSQLLTEELSYKYGIDGKISYSLTFTQGDGLCFDTDKLLTIQSMELLKIELNKKIVYQAKIQAVLKLIEDGKIQVKTQNDNHRYVYASRNQVKVFYNGDEDDYKELSVQDIWIIEECIHNVYLSIANALENIGYKTYDISDEDIIEMCSINNWVFLEDGHISPR
jgi:hypothetical protein